MPWQEHTIMSERVEFLQLAEQASLPFATLCERFGISRKTGYKWLGRAQQGVALVDQSRRPVQSPTRTPVDIEAKVVALRQRYPVWGGRKIAALLRRAGEVNVPAPSTITHILRRHGLLHERVAGEGGRYHRFEHEAPNHLWQMDFKGDFALVRGRCYPLTVLDDHSRFNVVLQAGSTMQANRVRTVLIGAFERYGLPVRMNMDNGSPWGSPSAAEHGLSQLSIWLIRLGIAVSFSRPAHPQTNGKEERFHRTLKTELLQRRVIRDLKQAQRLFDDWRLCYNSLRPHDSLNLDVPASRYRPSERPYPRTLPPIEYAADDEVCSVGWNGVMKWRGHRFKVSSALKDLPVAIRVQQDGSYHAFFCHYHMGKIDRETQVIHRRKL
jgi:transposase InsO family protein